jgi:hypothetical protein
MPIYWTNDSIPELAGLPKEERNAVWRNHYKLAFRHWQTWVGALICGLCAAAGGFFGVMLGSKYLGLAIGGGVGGFIFAQILITQVRPYLRQYLAEKQKEKTG